MLFRSVVPLAVACAALAGSRTLPGPSGVVLPARAGVRAVFAYASAGLLICMAAFRDRIGTDYGQYARSYAYEYREWRWADFSWSDEPGIRILTWISVRIYDDPVTLMALAALITIGLFMKVYEKYSTFFALSVLFFVLVGAWHGAFNGVRQYLAAAIVVAGHHLILDRKFVRYLLLVAVAALFHISAWVLILLYFVPRRKMTPVATIVLISVSLFAANGYELAGSVISAIGDGDPTSTAYFTRNLHPLRIALAFVPYVAYLFFSDKERLSERSQFHINIALLYGAMYAAVWGSAHLARFAIYLAPFVALAVPAVLDAPPKRTRPILMLVLIVVYFGFWYIEVSGSPELNPYRWNFGTSQNMLPSALGARLGTG